MKEGGCKNAWAACTFGTLSLASKPAEWMDAVRIRFGNTAYYRNKPGIPIWVFKG